jgi:hypothetical protein
MIHIEDFSKMLSGELEILRSQTAGLSHEESLIQPKPGGNCLNWILGHLAVNLLDVLKVLDAKTPDNLPDLSRYKIGSQPIRGEEEGILSLEDLIKTYTLLNKQIIHRLDQMSVDDFEEEIDFWQGKSRRGYVAFFYFFHNTYHLGQLEFLRNLAGKTEKVI